MVGDALDGHVVALSMLAYLGCAAASKLQLHARRKEQGPAVVVKDDIGVLKCDERWKDMRSEGDARAKTRRCPSNAMCRKFGKPSQDRLHLLTAHSHSHHLHMSAVGTRVAFK